MSPRQTTQRAAIRQAIEHADRPLSPQEILELAQASQPSLGIATVYRAVKKGVEDAWLTPVDLPHGPTRYEPAGKKHHHHFECTACNAVFELEGCPTPPSKLKPLVPEGCQLTGHEVILYGLCRDCHKSA